MLRYTSVKPSLRQNSEKPGLRLNSVKPGLRYISVKPVLRLNSESLRYRNIRPRRGRVGTSRPARRYVKARSRNVGRANKQGPGDDYKARTVYAYVRGISSEASASTDYAQVRGMSSEGKGWD